jgi:hypothetical protein
MPPGDCNADVGHDLCGGEAMRWQSFCRDFCPMATFRSRRGVFCATWQGVQECGLPNCATFDRQSSIDPRYRSKRHETQHRRRERIGCFTPICSTTASGCYFRGVKWLNENSFTSKGPMRRNRKRMIPRQRAPMQPATPTCCSQPGEKNLEVRLLHRLQQRQYG